MPRKSTIEAIARGTPWPSGRPKALAQLDVDDAWVVNVAGVPLISGVEDGLGPWVGIGGKLPSGTCVELLRYDLGGPLYQLHTDYDASPRETLEEFLTTTGLEPSAVHWRHPEA